MKKLIRLLYEVHRWLGIALALFMLMWFFSGLVIMYSPTLTQTRSGQLAHAETLSPEVGWLSLGEAWERSAQQRQTLAKPKDTQPNEVVSIVDARLVRSAGKPLWLIEDTQAQHFALSALDGALHKTSIEDALIIADHWHSRSNRNGLAQAQYLATLDKTILLRNQDALSPFYQIAIGDDGGQVLISEKTGEVLHASNTMSRAFYWAGNWLHLFKPLDALGYGKIRNDVQLWSGLLATVATLTGLIIGWLRWRPGIAGRPTYSQGRTQPYREFWFKWHFWTGLIGGTVMLCWAGSGFLDTNPKKIFSQNNPNRQEISRYIGQTLPETMMAWQPVLPLDLAMAVGGEDVVELSWKHLDNAAVLLAHTRNGQRLPQRVDGAKTRFDETVLFTALNRVAAKTITASSVLLQDYDDYYYARQDQSQVEKPLPVWRVTLADDQNTQWYIDPQDGKLLSKIDRRARIFRWAYSALHHWDFGWLKYRPLWDVWMLVWVSFGLVLSVSSLVIGWRRLKQTFGFKKTRDRKPASRKMRYTLQGAVDERP